MARWKKIESSSGRGEVLRNGEKVSSVQYNLSVKQEVETVETYGDTSESLGRFHITGQVIVRDGDKNLADGAEYRLVLKDERFLDVTFPKGDPVSGL